MSEKKRVYLTPTVDVIAAYDADVISTSSKVIELPIIPASSSMEDMYDVG